MNRFKKLTILIFFNILFLLLLIVITEITVRLLFPDINPQGGSSNLYYGKKFGDTHGLKSNTEGHSMGARVITNALGFRIDPQLPPVIKNKHTIIVLGDSVSLGIGVAANNAYPYILQRKFKDYQIINTSVFGYGVSDYFNVLKNLLLRLHFEGVIVSLCLNDFSLVSQSDIKKTLENDLEIRYPNHLVRFLKIISIKYFDYVKYLRAYSRTYRLIKKMVTDTSKNYFAAEKLLYDSPEGHRLIDNDLMKIRDLADKNGKWIIFFIFPYEYQLRQNPTTGLIKPQKVINEIALKEKMTIIDLYPIFKRTLQDSKLNSRSLYLYDDAMHLSASGHRIVAQAIYNELIERGLAR